MAATQAYYYAIFASVIYFAVSSILVLAQYKALRTNRGDSGQNGKERLGRHKLMMGTIFFLLYVIAGAAVFAHIERWYYLDGIYWADSTLLTIGFGDLFPSTLLGQCLLFPYALIGIVTISIVVYSIMQVASDAEVDSVEISVAKWLRGRRVKKSFMGKESDQSASSRAGQPSGEDRFMEVKSDRRLASVIAFAIWGLAWAAFWLVGAAVFHASERAQGWTYAQSVYFTYTSLLVIGYGDFHPQSPFGKAFFVIWSLLAVPVVTILISTTTEVIGYIFLRSDLMGDYVVKQLEDLFGKSDREDRQHSIHHDTPESVLHNTDNEHKKTHFLARTIAQLLRHHLNQTHTKPFTYQEWEYFISLIHVLRSDHSCDVRNPPDSLQMDSQDDEALRSTLAQWHLEKCDWMSQHNPIMMSKPEMEWLLEGLMVELVELIGRLSEE
ncbi:hypothetical protein GP486_000340 [Trichoglossum hirsutum]|uniref:Potassium channel domain-containing protein n=1 Tax=Trichoglossum hirsutum TaxID=265104 RepID=A0A9P8RTN2_9PEZI|nr:hypothetical protein GP486_000340 [Trichoglossum hirsutum]